MSGRSFARRKLRALPVVALVATASAAHEAHAVDRYVTPYGGSDTTRIGIANDCANVGAPCRTIAHAIGQAADGDIVKAAYGIYRENLSFPVGAPRLLSIEGGWQPGFSERLPDPAAGTTIQAASNGPVLLVDAVGQPALLTVDGFTLTGGTSDQGGGVFARSRSDPNPNYIATGGSLELRLRNDRIVDNHGGNGGGVAVVVEPNVEVQPENYAFLELSNSRLSDNTANTLGGAVYGSDVSGVLMLELSDDVFSGNAASSGSAVYVETSDPDARGTLTLARDVVTSNPTNEGAAIELLANVYSSVTASLVNDMLAGNADAAGLWLRSEGLAKLGAQLTNLTIAGNAAGVATMGGNPQFQGSIDLGAINCILAGNAAADLVLGAATTRAEVSYSNLRQRVGSSGFVEGLGNFSAESRFAGPGDYHLRADSPEVDAGACYVRTCTPSRPPICIRERVAPVDDFEGDPRPTPGTGCDVGADEFAPDLSPTSSAVAVAGVLGFLGRRTRRERSR